MLHYKIITTRRQPYEIIKYADSYGVFDDSVMKCGLIVFVYDDSREVLGCIGINMFGDRCAKIAVNNAYTSEHFTGMVNHFQLAYNSDLFIDVNYALLVRDYAMIGFVIVSELEGDGVVMMRDHNSAVISQNYRISSHATGKYCYYLELHSVDGSHDGSISYNLLNQSQYYVDRLFVKEQLRGKGLGKFLLQIIITLAKYSGKSVGLFSVNNSEKFYAKLGFVRETEPNWKGSVDMILIA